MNAPARAHALYRRWIDEVWGGQPIPDDIVAKDFVGHWPDRDVHGLAGLADVIAETRNMFRELTFVVEIGPLVDGDWMAARWVGTGRLTDATVRFFGNDILRVADGRIVEYWTGTSSGS